MWCQWRWWNQDTIAKFKQQLNRHLNRQAIWTWCKQMPDLLNAIDLNAFCLLLIFIWSYLRQWKQNHADQAGCWTNLFARLYLGGCKTIDSLFLFIILRMLAITGIARRYDLFLIAAKLKRNMRYNFISGSQSQHEPGKVRAAGFPPWKALIHWGFMITTTKIFLNNF